MEDADKELKSQRVKKSPRWSKDLRYERIRRGWSQADVAKFIGSDVRTVRRWELGQGVPQPFYVQKLAEVFGKSPEELGLIQDENNETTQRHFDIEEIEEQPLEPSLVSKQVQPGEVENWQRIQKVSHTFSISVVILFLAMLIGLVIGVLLLAFDAHFFKAPILTIGNVIIGLIIAVSTGTSIIVFQKQRTRKEIAYAVISDVPLLSWADEVKGRVEVLLDNKPVTNLHRIVLRVWNSGAIPIISSDFIEPIRFEFPKEGEILESKLVETIPKEINVALIQHSKNLMVEPLLLNSGDSFTIKVLLAGSHTKVNMVARIVGIKKISRFDTKTPQRGRLAFLVGTIWPLRNDGTEKHVKQSNDF